MLSTRSQILHLIDQGMLDPKDAEAAMEAAGVIPDGHDWYHFVKRLLLGLGILATALGVVFFVAYNWDALEKFGKFTLVEGAVAASLLPLLWYDLDSRIGQFALLSASILVGALLALFGQTYQTGADTWQLFATWGVLILPWVVLGRFEPLWLLWIGVVNVAIVLYFTLFGFFFFVETADAAVAVVLFNALAVVVYESRLPAVSEGDPRIGVRLVATVTGVAATMLALDLIIGASRHVHWLEGAVWLVWTTLHCWVYRQQIRDLFMLAGGCLSLIIAGGTLLIRAMIKAHIVDAVAFLIMALLLVLAGSGAAAWLRNTARAWEAHDD